MPAERLENYKNSGISDADAKIIINQKQISDFFDETLKFYDSPKTVSNFIVGELMRRVNLGEMSLDAPAFSPKEAAKLVELADTEKISKNDIKTIFRIMAASGGDPEEIAKKEGLLITVDTGKAEEIIDAVLAENEKAVTQYRNGDQKVFGFIMGQCTKQLKGTCTPKIIKEILEEKLK
jgi:aspartyl-tRNA(Asn)/glutamyl-tRNA(Gln) amidotransferase subunit B